MNLKLLKIKELERKGKISSCYRDVHTARRVMLWGCTQQQRESWQRLVLGKFGFLLITKVNGDMKHGEVGLDRHLEERG